MHGLCRLQDAAGRVEACPGEACPYWDEDRGSCVLTAIAGELPSRPDLAQYLLELRRELDETAPGTLFYRLRGRPF